MNPAPCNKDGGWLDPRPAWVCERLRSALDGKRDRARQFDPTLHPVWLLMVLDDERELVPRFVPELVQSALDDCAIDPYDRVVVTYSGIAPMVFESQTG